MSDETPIGTAAGSGSPDPDDSGASRPARSPQPARRQAKGSFLRELPVLLAIAVVLALLINTFLVKAFFIPSGSMERTLHGCPGCSGDRVLVDKVGYRLHDPRPGDIVVFAGPESWAPEAAVEQPTNPLQRAVRAIGSTFGVAAPGEKDFIKRVIAVGGQTVQCCDAQGRVTVDGRPLDEPYRYVTDPEFTSTPFGPVTVPPGRLWVMGDHRDESADSRAHITDPNKGTIALDDVIGKAFVIIWPVSRWDTLGTPATFGGGEGSPWTVPLLVAVPVLLVVLFALFSLRRRRAR
jgi:signal peptidase I